MYAHDATHLLTFVCLLGRRLQCIIIALIVRVRAHPETGVSRNQGPLQPTLCHYTASCANANTLLCVAQELVYGSYGSSTAIISSREAALEHPENHDVAMIMSCTTS